MFFRSRRLFLRPAWTEDADALHALVTDRRIARALMRAPAPQQIDCGVRPLLSGRDAGLPMFVVTLPGAQGAEVIGSAGLVRHGDGVELLCLIGRQHWGQGYGTEAADAVLQIGASLGHAEVRAAHFVDNPAAGRMFEKLGFERSARIAERYSEGRGLMLPAREYRRVLAAAPMTTDDVPVAA